MAHPLHFLPPRGRRARFPDPSYPSRFQAGPCSLQKNELPGVGSRRFSDPGKDDDYFFAVGVFLMRPGVILIARWSRISCVCACKLRLMFELAHDGSRISRRRKSRLVSARPLITSPYADMMPDFYFVLEFFLKKWVFTRWTLVLPGSGGAGVRPGIRVFRPARRGPKSGPNHPAHSV